MEFTYAIITEKTVNIDFKDIYNIQIDDFFNNLLEFEQKDIESDKCYLFDDFGDNAGYYLYRIGLTDFDECENEYALDVICREYGYWLDDNYNPSDFK